VQGKECLKKTFTGKQLKIRTEDLAPGIYMIKISESNQVIYQAKAIRVTK